MATRRAFLAGAAATGLASAAGGPAASAAAHGVNLVSAAHVAGRPCGIVWGDAAPLTSFDLPGRGHAITRLGADEVLIVGRRPGQFAAAVDVRAGAVRTVMTPSSGARFSGHGAVSPDGKRLLTSEFDEASIEGRVTLRDPATGAERAVWLPGGLEPHDMGFAADGARLVVALGGLVRDGGVAGPVLNPEGVRSSVVEIDPASGRILTRHALAGPELRSLSLRHLAFSPDGRRVGVGMQDQDMSVRRPLVGILEVGGRIDLLPMPDPAEIDFRGYVGSVGIDRGGNFLVATSPRGGVAGLWSMRDGRWLGGLHLQDACGLARGGEAGVFWLSSGYGEVLKLRASQAGLAVVERHQAGVGFDNHLLRI